MGRLLQGMEGASLSRARETPRSVLLLASRQAMYQSLANAFQQHFGSYDVELAESGGEVNVRARTCLILIKATSGDFTRLGATVEQVRALAPDIPIGLLVDEDWPMADLGLAGRVQGILPLWLPLEVLMAIASLLVAGGQYLPQSAASPSARMSPVEVDAPDEASSATDEAALRPSFDFDAHMLTAREEQILQYVSEGFQNKLIADRMALSEHTVKAHVHKVIAKLGVSNRTQAAAAFLRRNKGGGATTAPASGLAQP